MRRYRPGSPARGAAALPEPKGDVEPAPEEEAAHGPAQFEDLGFAVVAPKLLEELVVDSTRIVSEQLGEAEGDLLAIAEILVLEVGELADPLLGRDLLLVQRSAQTESIRAVVELRELEAHQLLQLRLQAAAGSQGSHERGE